MFKKCKIFIFNLTVLISFLFSTLPAQAAPGRTHVSYVFYDSIKYVLLDNGQTVQNTVLDSSPFQKGFLTMKVDQQGHPYFAYAINRATFDTHWFVMFRSLAYAQSQILPIAGYIIPLGVSLVIDEHTAIPTFYVVALVQSIDGTPSAPQRMYLFKR